MKKTWSELIAKLAKIGTGAAVGAAVVVGFSAANRNPRESAVVLSNVPVSSVSAEYSSPSGSAISANVESNHASENSQNSETRNTEGDKPYLININTASSRRLQELSGIGEAKAAAIIEYREMHGGFSDISELLNVSGIGEGIFENIRDYITVGDAPPKEPTSSETSTPSPTVPTAPAQIPVVNINTASAEELEQLPGIGSAKAMAVVQYRSVFGDFTDINEIKNVDGIGESVFEGIRDYITVGNVSPRPVEDTPQAPEEIYVNLNTATKSELCKIPGIGTVKAQAIIDYRRANGDFYSIEEIKNVSGIGEKMFESIREYIYVEYRERPGNDPNSENSDNPVQSEPAVNFPVNLNTATKNELCKIPGIGTAKAQAIIDYRKANGDFYSIEEIKNVSGIGEKMFESIREYIYVEYRERPGDNPNSENSDNPVQSKPAVNYPVNLNTATLEELCTLPYIDEKTARAIIQFRIDHEGFNDIRELQHIEGINLAIIQSLRDIITV